MLKKAAFYDFLNRRSDCDFDQFMAESVEDEHYINWNEYLLPHDYGDAEEEYKAIRGSCALFDVSPLRKIRVRGVGAGAFLDHLFTRPVGTLASMRATYVIYCNEDGSLKDDSILYKFDDDDYLLMPSDVDHSPYFESLREQIGVADVSFTECTDSWVGFAIQGPRSAAALLTMGFEGVEQLKPFQVRDYTIRDGTVRIARVGFTADLGFECWFEPGLADAMMRHIQSARLAMNIAIPGYGLSALQACRLEGGFVVAGWDFSTELDPTPGFERSPYEVGLGWLVNLEGSEFVGREALMERTENGHDYALRCFESDSKTAPEDGSALRAGSSEDATVVGLVNCSNWSWGLGKTIGNASMQSEYADLESAWVEIAGDLHEVTLSRGPLLSLDRRNEVPASVEIDPGGL